MKPVTLKDTVEMMNSEDYKERFRAEYHQVGLRSEKLQNILDKYDAGTLEFKPTCSIVTLTAQLTAMKVYLLVLQERANEEGIEL